LKSKWNALFALPRVGASRTAVLAWSAVAIAIIALIDRYFDENISFGFLYLFPMLMMGAWLRPWQLALVAALCTALTEAFDPFPWAMPVGLSRMVLTFAACFGAGFYRYAAARDKRAADRHLHDVEQDAARRLKAEEQLEFLISSSPAPIFTLDAAGKVLLANGAAHRLLRVGEKTLEGQDIVRYFPALGTIPSSQQAPFFHTEMECRGHRRDGEAFMAHVWFSTYQTTSGPRLAAVVFDTSDELRDRAEFNLQQVMTGSRVLVGALCHEIRNICGAIGVVHATLSRNREFADNHDFKALGSLVEGLKKMAGLELRQSAQFVAESTDLRSVLEELRIVIEPAFEESGLTIDWQVPPSLPRVWADRHALMQAFLNLAKNSQRAMEGRGGGRLAIQAAAGNGSVAIRFKDSGTGVANPERLFEPFQPGAQATGLGLYVSRAFVRAFEGDIEYEPQATGSCFAVSLTPAVGRR
jgi:nitrogen-specific signal transduction histidine kinase